VCADGSLASRATSRLPRLIDGPHPGGLW
jgi:hypothetical protein